ncbi:efflux RND transporter periplasmic adaptor subunit [Phyllobacterium myrsinacearum]|uniref:Efflux transporter periplasmic adaptor subunit n=2 Tax=Pseudomonadota TaxID=1224 RepID=A0A2S9J9U2_9HYPH|nr:efflux RND transporter periplasmic adaptor subunit [Phyllobacterium myrsinacearum]PRD49555.1 efflux transporter periplasmic adaptor subunit [Phyllobacterium myrsinacearum]PWV83567.1 membrane fusion protein (multidrug efflux system) [Phyllobacterium myrsinacearum]RZU96831.1 membrane fusion protein (multidrug efflux system) [Phyllobacterium myrsinacearum]
MTLLGTRFLGLVFFAGAALALNLPANAQQAGGKTPPPPQVTAVAVQPEEVDLSYQYAARITAYRDVQVRARVGGILLKRNFVEGSEVKAGELLFEIDPAPYEAELARVQAQLQQAQAQYAQSVRDADRAQALVDQKVQSTAARDTAVSTRDLNAAAVAAAKAQVRTAELNLQYTKVTAPINGVTSREQVSEGSLIGTDAASSLLTSITQTDPVYINFSFTDTEAAEIRRLLDERKAKGLEANKLSVKLYFGDGTVYNHLGTIDFTSSSLDLETGTLGVRAIIDNPDRRLLPGQFVRATVTGVTVNDTIVIPEAALMQGPKGQFVYIVNNEGKAEVRPLNLGQQVNKGWIVLSGLAAGDRVVTEGVIKVKPGQLVSATDSVKQALVTQ